MIKILMSDGTVLHSTDDALKIMEKIDGAAKSGFIEIYVTNSQGHNVLVYVNCANISVVDY